MPPQLRALTEGPDLLLDKPIILIGRHQECDIQIPSRKISRRHCCIAQVNDHLVVRDLYSTNGVQINGVRVCEGTLNAGDELTIASLRYQVCSSDPQDVPNGKSEPHHGHDSLESSDQPIALDEPNSLQSCDEPIPLDESGPLPPPALEADDRPSGEINPSWRN